MTHKEATETKACCNCIHCQRWHKRDGIECHCDIDDHYQGYLEVMGTYCELWEKDEWKK